MLEAFRKMLRPNETVIYSREGGFTLSNQSTLGTHSLGITNQGRVLVHDTGGLFGNTQAREYDGGQNQIKLIISLAGVKLENARSGAFSFTFFVSLPEFMGIFKALPNGTFLLNQPTDKWPCYVQGDGISPTLALGSIERTGDSLYLEHAGKMIVIPMGRIRKFDYSPDGVGVIRGIFDHLGKTVYEINLFTPHLALLAEIERTSRNAQGIYSLIGHDAAAYFVDGVHWGGRYVAGPLFLYADSRKWIVIEEKSLSKLLELDQDAVPFYWDESNGKLAAILRDRLMQFDIANEDTVAFLKSDLCQPGNRLFCGSGLLIGTFRGRLYDGEEVDLLLGSRELRFYDKERDILSEARPFSQTEILVDRDLLFISEDGAIAVLEMTDQTRLEISGILTKECPAISDDRLGCLPDATPFTVLQDDSYITLMQSRDRQILSIPLSEVHEFRVLSRPENSCFVEIEVSVTAEGKDNLAYTLFVTPAQLERFIFLTYHAVKSRQLVEIRPQHMMQSWGRQLNDYVVYQYFGYLFALYEGMKEITRESQSDRDTRNNKLINFLYYGIQIYKRNLDMVSVYLPAMLEQEDRKLAFHAGEAFSDHPYRQWRNSLQAVQAQMLRHLNELDNALSSASGAIIPKEHMDEIYTRKLKRSKVLGVIGGGAALGTAVLMTGPIGLLVAAPTLISGINGYFNAKDGSEMEKIRQRNEKKRYDFLVERIIGSFDHLMETMLPYYISEINRVTFGFFLQTEEQLRPAYAFPAFKNDLLLRVSSHYTYQQLPIDESVNKPKKELIALIHETVEQNEKFVLGFQREVAFDV